MPYQKTTWVDNVTAITAARLNNIENGVESANSVIPLDAGQVGQVLTKKADGAEWADPTANVRVVDEVLEL